MDEVTAEIKSKIDIVDLVSGYLSLKKAGRNYHANCPFHHEKTPSFMVSPELQIFKCFGCQEGGDVFSFVMKMEGLDFPGALKMLADRAGVKLRTTVHNVADSRKERLYQINQLAAEFFHFLLAKHRLGERARHYLTERGVTETTTKAFLLGYAPSSWRSLSSFLLKKGYSLSEIVESGLAVPRKSAAQGLPVYDRFRCRLVFPLRDSLGRTLGFSGRALGQEEPKYLNSPETSIFKKGSFLYGLDLTKQEIKKSETALIVEGQFDLILPYQEGFRSIVASLGTALTDQQLRILSRFTKKILLAFDQDVAGSEALVRSVALAENLGFTVSAVTLPEGAKDPDEAVRLKKSEFGQAVAADQPFYDYYLVLLTKGLKKGNLREKKAAAEKFLSQLARVESPLTRSHYLRELSKVLDIEVKALEQALEARKRRGLDEPKKPTAGSLAVSRDRDPYLLEKYLLSLLLQMPSDLVREVLPKISPQDFASEVLKSIFAVVRKSLLEKKASVDAKTIRAKLDESNAAVFDELFLLDLGEAAESRGSSLAEINSTLARLKRGTIKREVENLSQNIGAAEKKGDFKEVEILQRELQKAAEKLK